MGNDSLQSARQVRNPVLTNGDINDAFDSITYQKGGSVLSMFETYLGEDRFREGIRVHMRRFADGVADVDDFMESLDKTPASLPASALSSCSPASRCSTFPSAATVARAK